MSCQKHPRKPLAGSCTGAQQHTATWQNWQQNSCYRVQFPICMSLDFSIADTCQVHFPAMLMCELKASSRLAAVAAQSKKSCASNVCSCWNVHGELATFNSSALVFYAALLSANYALKYSEIWFWWRQLRKMFHAPLRPRESAVIILTRWEPSLTSCTCCTCGSATTLVSWSEVMSCLLFGCSERTLLVTFVSCGNTKTKDSVSGSWNSWELAAIPDMPGRFRPKVQRASTPQGQD